MNARLLALAAVSTLAVSVFAAGCGSAPDVEPSETGEQAMQSSSSGGTPGTTVSCGEPQAWNLNDPFQKTMWALGCTAPTPEQRVAGTYDLYEYETVCPTGRYIWMYCPAHPNLGDAAGWYYRDLMYAISADCYGGVSPYLPGGPYYHASCQALPSGDVSINFDPNCTGTGCSGALRN